MHLAAVPTSETAKSPIFTLGLLDTRLVNEGANSAPPPNWHRHLLAVPTGESGTGAKDIRPGDEQIAW
jgi:hypothetical protein